MPKKVLKLLSENIKVIFHKYWRPILEFTTIILIALWLGRAYLDFDPNKVVEGGEFFLPTLSHFAWKLLPKCGACVFWNGYINGGYPAFTELLGAFLHPLVFITTLLFGVINGSKVIILVCIATIGLGQWWLGREMKLGCVARLWASIMAMIGGHVLGRLQGGDIPLILSIASASLILPVFIRLKKDPSWRRTILAAVVLALTWLSGQGYIQIVVILAYLPTIFLYLLNAEKPKYVVCKKALSAVLLSIVLISILLVPLIHFMGNWQKILANKLDSIQPLGYSLTNLVINDLSFYDTTAFEKTVTPWAHINYIGWLPIFLMVLGSVILVVKKKRRELGFLWLTMALAFVFSSRDPYIPFRNLAVIEQLRSINVGASLAIQPLLLLAAIGLDAVFNFHWPIAKLGELSQNDKVQLKITKWLALIAVIFFSIKAPYQFGSQFLGVRPILIDQKEIALLKTNSSQWVQQLDFDWLPNLLESDAKVIIPPEPWSWKDREKVGPLLRVADSRNEPNATGVIQNMGVLALVRDDSQEYAVLSADEMRIPCAAKALGGRIDVNCSAGVSGTLVVREYYWQGWYAWIDGEPAYLDKRADFLTLSAPAGNHTFHFEYRPWDVWVGLVLSFLGVLFCCILWWKEKRPQGMPAGAKKT
jgi:hypothetical protein